MRAFSKETWETSGEEEEYYTAVNKALGSLQRLLGRMTEGTRKIDQTF